MSARPVWQRLARLIPPPQDVNLLDATARDWWMPTARGWALIATGAACIVRGVSFLDPRAPVVSLTAYEDVLPLSWAGPLREAFAMIWILVGLFLLLEVARRRWRLSMSAAAALHVAWALGALASWVLAGEPRAYVTAARDLQTAVLISAVSVMLDPIRAARRRPR